MVCLTPEIVDILGNTFPNYQPAGPSSLSQSPSPRASASALATSIQPKDTKGEKFWSKAATVLLIDLRSKFSKEFKSTTLKNDQVWNLVSQEMTNNNFPFSGQQCRDKWQYLKKRYVKKRDNMGPRGTGEDVFKFEYFDEMDALLRNKHSITPPAIASSIKGTTKGMTLINL